MSLRTPLNQVLGLGSAKEGVSHWWWQRVTAIVLVPLLIWFMFAWIGKLDAQHTDVVQWLHSPWIATFLVILLAMMFYHAALGLQVVIEDYVHTEWLKVASILLVKFILAVMAVVCVVSVIMIGAQ